ncbi:MAG TPA: hypothetical protein VHQ90_10015 [Thermoanaerobaculia bacterium]|nr:hypothetical protein [Thermoanaerobaculia bacterium]
MSRQGLHRVLPGLAIAAALNLTAPGRAEAAWAFRANSAAGWSDVWSAAWSKGASWWDDLWARVGPGPSRGGSRPSTEARFSGVSRKEGQHDGDSSWHRDDRGPGSEGACSVNPNGVCSPEH